MSDALTHCQLQNILNHKSINIIIRELDDKEDTEPLFEVECHK